MASFIQSLWPFAASSDPKAEGRETSACNRPGEEYVSIQNTGSDSSPTSTIEPGTTETAKRNAIRQGLIDLAWDNPINLDTVFENGDFPTRKAAAVWLNRQEESGDLKSVGLMKDAQGRKVMKVFCNGWNPKDDNLRHEVVGTQIRLLFQDFRFIRGYRVTDCLCDMLMTDGDHTYEIEIDCGTMKQRQVRWRWKKHKCQRDILVITSPKSADAESRLNRLVDWSDELGERAFFTTLDRLKTHGPHARVWDYIGRGEQPLMMVNTAVASPFQLHTVATPETATAEGDRHGPPSGN